MRQVIAGLVSLALVGLVGCSGGSDNADVPAADSSAVSTPSTSTDDSASASSDAASSDAASDDAASDDAALPRLIVGTDITPGLNIADDLGTCYYARLASVDGSPNDALGQSNALGSQVFVTIEPTDAALISHACGSWRVATDADIAPTEGGGIPSDGMWLVPEQITPGTYQTLASDPSADCFFQTVSDLSASLSAVLETQQGLSGQVTMVIGPEVRAVRAYRCGEWSKVSE